MQEVRCSLTGSKMLPSKVGQAEAKSISKHHSYRFKMEHLSASTFGSGGAGNLSVAADTVE